MEKDNTPESHLFLLLLSCAIPALCLWGGRFGPVGRSMIHITTGFGELALPSWRFIILLLCLSFCCMLMLFYYPRKLSRSHGAMVIFCLSLFCRILLLPHQYSDDLNRYLWEGRMVATGINPFHHAPSSDFLKEAALGDPYHGEINHPEISAAYPPLALCIFSLVTRISYTPAAMKAVVLLFDLGTIIFLMLMLNLRRLDPGWVVLYCFNPVILISFAGKGHFDAMQLFFLSGGFYFYQKKRWIPMFLFLGFSIQIKYVGAVVLPFFVNRKNCVYLPVAALSALLPFIPFVDGDLPALFSGIVRFGGGYAFNGSIHWIFRVLLGGIEPATAVCSAVLLLLLFHGYFRYHPQRETVHRDDPLPGCLHALGLVLIFAPTVHYWYLSWIIPLLVLRPSLPWLVLTVTFSVYFVTCGYAYHENRWHLPVFFLLLEWLPFYALLLFDLRRFLKNPGPKGKFRKPESVSVVIPVKNESLRIEGCIHALGRDRAVREIIVVDADSTDNTAEIAEKAGARVIRHTAREKGNGRGGQILTGLSAATCDVAAVVHADTEVTGPVFSRMIRVLAKNGDIVGGAVGTRFRERRPGYRLLEFANSFRAVFLGISFGDQIQFFRLAPVLEGDLYPPIPLMEDVEFSIRMRSSGRGVFLFGGGRASSRRWKRRGIRNSVDVIRWVMVYLVMRITGPPDTAAMYRDYYGFSLNEKKIP